MVISVSSSPETLCAEATGLSFTALTVMPTVASDESSVPSLAIKVKLSAPLKSAFGVYNQVVSVCCTNVPLVTLVAIENDKSSFSSSVAASVIINDPSSSKSTD